MKYIGFKSITSLSIIYLSLHYLINNQQNGNGGNLHILPVFNLVLDLNYLDLGLKK